MSQNLEFMERGVLVGADVSQEWLLPFWLENYKKKNSLPVCFFDLGMSEKTKNWCHERGILKTIEKKAAKAWFLKPIACQMSPFKESLWIDLDCEVKKKVDPIFDLIDSSIGITLAQDQFSLPEIFYPTFNSGVVAFHQNSSIVTEWAYLSEHISHLYPGDQDLLSAIFFKKSIWLHPLPSIYNWSHRLPPPKDVKIIHWHGLEGKKILKSRILSTRNEMLF